MQRMPIDMIISIISEEKSIFFLKIKHSHAKNIEKSHENTLACTQIIIKILICY